MEGADNCFIVNGGFTLLGDLDEQNLFSAVEPTLFATEVLMNSGRLNEVHPDVVNVRFVSADNGNNSGDDDDDDTDRGNVGLEGATGSDSVRAWPWVLLSLGGAFVLFGAAFTRRRRRQQQHQQQQQQQADMSATTGS